MFLLDTNVLSALRRRERHPEAARWLAAQRTADLYLSAVTVGEIERGIARQQHPDPSFAGELSGWLDRVLAWYGDRVLDVDVPTARRWGRLSGDLGHESADLVIAATALEHGLTVVTRNVRHFEPAGVNGAQSICWKRGVRRWLKTERKPDGSRSYPVAGCGRVCPCASTCLTVS